MEKNKALSDKLAGDALKGTFDPPVKKGPPPPLVKHVPEPPAEPGPEDEPEITESEQRVLDGNR